MSEEKYETLRFPTSLDREAIVARLVAVREEARAAGVTEIAERLADIESMSSPKIGATVVAALTWLQDVEGLDEIAAQLNMVAMNLKNLK